MHAPAQTLAHHQNALLAYQQSYIASIQRQCQEECSKGQASYQAALNALKQSFERRKMEMEQKLRHDTAQCCAMRDAQIAQVRAQWWQRRGNEAVGSREGSRDQGVEVQQREGSSVVQTGVPSGAAAAENTTSAAAELTEPSVPTQSTEMALYDRTKTSGLSDPSQHHSSPPAPQSSECPRAFTPHGLPLSQKVPPVTETSNNKPKDDLRTPIRPALLPSKTKERSRWQKYPTTPLSAAQTSFLKNKLRALKKLKSATPFLNCSAIKDDEAKMEQPMSLTRVYEGVLNGTYSSLRAVVRDVDLIVQNFAVVRGREHADTLLGRRMVEVFEGYLGMFPGGIVGKGVVQEGQGQGYEVVDLTMEED